ncbi:MAG: hypothetical protein IPL59_17245 [Candidatus Competibacteraceae bacterium]|nr:hypothetical protein [Candidatus Competibacteraceae bacterium]
MNQVAEAVKVSRIGYHLLFEKFGEFGEAAGTHFEKLLNESVQLVNFSVGSGERVLISEALNPGGKGFL